MVNVPYPSENGHPLQTFLECNIHIAMHSLVANEVHQAPHIPPVCIDLLTFNSEGKCEYNIIYLVVGRKNDFVGEFQRDYIAALVPLGNLLNHVLGPLSFAFRFKGKADTCGRKQLAH